MPSQVPLPQQEPQSWPQELQFSPLPGSQTLSPQTAQAPQSPAQALQSSP